MLGVFSYTAPLAFATGGSKATNNILASWSKMFGGQVVLVILNAWCMKMFLSGYGNMMASSYGFTKFFAATLCLVGFCKITFKLDSYNNFVFLTCETRSNRLKVIHFDIDWFILYYMRLDLGRFWWLHEKDKVKILPSMSSDDLCKELW